jgi:hypothetical protein
MMGSYQPEVSGSVPVPQREIGKPRSIGLTILLAVVTFGIWTFLWTFWNGEELKRYRVAGLGGGIFLLFHFLVFPVVMFLMADEVAKLYEEDGQQAPITAIWGLWVLLPLIGHIIWYVRIQQSLNDFWLAKGAPDAKGV